MAANYERLLILKDLAVISRFFQFRGRRAGGKRGVSEPSICRDLIPPPLHLFLPPLLPGAKAQDKHGTQQWTELFGGRCLRFPLLR
jgi:hypothetical protein